MVTGRRDRSLVDAAFAVPFAFAAVAIPVWAGVATASDLLGDPVAGAALGRFVAAVALLVAIPVAVRRPAYELVTDYALDFLIVFLSLGVLGAVPLLAVGGVTTGSRVAHLLQWGHLLASYVLAAVETRYRPLQRLLVPS